MHAFEVDLAQFLVSVLNRGRQSVAPRGYAKHAAAGGLENIFIKFCSGVKDDRLFRPIQTFNCIAAPYRARIASGRKYHAH